jgi:DNA-binding NarL/FixJ family response regulator
LWRRHISSAVRQNLQCQLIGEAADGLEAVEKAERLKPDLIVLDIGLPMLNGIEAARRIRASVPDSKILFVSEHRSPEIAQAALATGARGYVVKSDAGSELLPALEAIIQGESFISARFARDEFLRAGRPRIPRDTRHHEVQFSSDEASLLDGFAGFSAAALEAGNATIAVTTSSHRNMLHQRLETLGWTSTSLSRGAMLDGCGRRALRSDGGWLARRHAIPNGYCDGHRRSRQSINLHPGPRRSVRRNRTNVVERRPCRRGDSARAAMGRARQNVRPGCVVWLLVEARP